MSQDEEQAREVFLVAVDLPPGRREAFLDDACSGNPSLRADVESLLRADEGARSRFLEPPGAATLQDPYTDSRRESAHASCGGLPDPVRIGPYRILRRLGEGGMGVVFLASQESPIRRRVALKLIRLGMDTVEVIARFESERQALALMNHPHIAKVYDAGATEDGRPFFVMEYIKGSSLDRYADRHKLSIRERLHLFLQVCRGVHHAHERGVIHRDLKPSNILVTRLDGEPAAKIIDFGVAKATDQRLAEFTIYTRIGRAIGTPEYMSPEQTEIRGAAVDHRTDVYSLGVVLYELLVGERPLDDGAMSRASMDEIFRSIRETEPPVPSSRFRRFNRVTMEHLAELRSASVSSCARDLRGDLDWITAKAMEKERARRYPRGACRGRSRIPQRCPGRRRPP
jgi:serine/threonine protein kinase